MISSFLIFRNKDVDLEPLEIDENRFLSPSAMELFYAYPEIPKEINIIQSFGFPSYQHIYRNFDMVQVFTQSDRNRYIFYRHLPKRGLSFCVCSHYPFFNLFRALIMECSELNVVISLRSINEDSMSQQLKVLERMLMHVVERPQHHVMPLTLNDEPVTTISSNPNSLLPAKFPSCGPKAKFISCQPQKNVGALQCDFDCLLELFGGRSAHFMARLYCSVLLGQRIVLLSKNLRKLSFSSYALASLIHPLRINTTHIPVVNNTTLLGNPSPFIFGVFKSALDQDDIDNLGSHWCSFDLDKDNFSFCGQDFIKLLPSSYINYFCRHWPSKQLISSCNYRKVGNPADNYTSLCASACIKTTAFILRDYSSAFEVFQSDQGYTTKFNRNVFFDAVMLNYPSALPFYKELFMHSHVMEFLHERGEALAMGCPIYDDFEFIVGQFQVKTRKNNFAKIWKGITSITTRKTNNKPKHRKSTTMVTRSCSAPTSNRIMSTVSTHVTADEKVHGYDGADDECSCDDFSVNGDAVNVSAQSIAKDGDLVQQMMDCWHSSDYITCSKLFPNKSNGFQPLTIKTEHSAHQKFTDLDNLKDGSVGTSDHKSATDKIGYAYLPTTHF